MVIDYGGQTIPWYDPVPIGARNYIKEEIPANPSAEDIQKYYEGQRYRAEKMREGSGGFGGFLTKYVNPVLDTAAADPLKTAAIFAATASGNAYLVPYIVGADTALAGGSPEDVLKSAATAYITQGVGSKISSALSGVEGIGLPSETPYIDLPDGEFLLTPDSVPSLLSDGGLTASEIDRLTNLAPETGSEINAYTTPIDTPAIGQPYDATPLTDPVTGQPFGSIEEPLVDNYMDGFTSTSETGLATLPEEGMQPDLPGTTILGDLGLAGAVETPIPSGGISVMQALRGLNLAKGLLGGGQEGAAAPATQFRGARLPQKEVDYSGILSLLQMRSPQRKSLLG